MQSKPSRWRSDPYEVATGRRLASELGVSPVVGSILARRGFGDLDEARRFLAAEESHDPPTLPGAPAACELILAPRRARLADRGVRRLRRGRRLLHRDPAPDPARARRRSGLGAAEPLRRGLRPLRARGRAAGRARGGAARHRRLRHHGRRAGGRRPRGGSRRGRHRPPSPGRRAARLHRRAPRARRTTAARSCAPPASS